MLTRVEVFVGGSCLLHIENTIQAHANPAGFNQRQHVFAYIAQNLSLLLIERVRRLVACTDRRRVSM